MGECTLACKTVIVLRNQPTCSLTKRHFDRPSITPACVRLRILDARGNMRVRVVQITEREVSAALTIQSITTGFPQDLLIEGLLTFSNNITDFDSTDADRRLNRGWSVVGPLDKRLLTWTAWNVPCHQFSRVPPVCQYIITGRR